MYNAHMQYLLFAALGVISGTVCGFGDLVLPGNEWVMKFYPGVVLGLFLTLAGYCVAQLNAAGRWRGILLSVLAAVAGWRLAVDVGYELGGSQLGFVSAGALGAVIIALGLVSAWRLGQAAVVPMLLIVTAAGALGGAVFQVLEAVLGIDDNNRIWAVLLFGEWQAVLMAGIAVALRYSKRLS
jgi:hypothetical protein